MHWLNKSGLVRRIACWFSAPVCSSQSWSRLRFGLVGNYPLVTGAILSGEDCEYRKLHERLGPEEKRLLKTAKRRLPKLKALLAEVSGVQGQGGFRSILNAFRKWKSGYLRFLRPVKLN